jgi:F-type H+-transporting ATPase subunit epsilon
MTPEKVNFTLVSPEKLVLTDRVDMVVVPGSSGDFGVLPRHSALISTLRPGLVTIYRGDKKEFVFISAGFANVTEKSCLVLGEDCEFVADMNLEELEKYAQRLREEIEIARTQKEIDELKKIHGITLLKLDLIRKLVH